MKTNRAARRVVKVRAILLVLVLVAITGLEFGLGERVASRLGQTTASQRDVSQFSSMGISDLMAIGH